MSADATNISFGRLFGPGGTLTTALTILLTLYVALFAFNLLTGRSALRVSVLTPRMMTMGLIITFVTSWVAYQSVVWNLAVGAPDEIAGSLLGTEGSATMMFAQRLDALFVAVTDAANSMSGTAAADEKLASPANMLWIASLILLLGTVGVLIVCKIALAALLILGPIFIVMALFDGTRGLFEGWLKSVAMLALVPLLTVVMGSGALMAMMPMAEGLATGAAEASLRTSVAILMASIVYLALMMLVLELARSLTSSWRLPGSVSTAAASEAGVRHTRESTLKEAAPAPSPTLSSASERVRTTVGSLNSFVSTSRVETMPLSGSYSPDFSGSVVHQVPAITAGRHSLYFSHRSQSASFPSPKEMFR